MVFMTQDREYVARVVVAHEWGLHKDKDDNVRKDSRRDTKNNILT
jgi:hypothetical protein